MRVGIVGNEAAKFTPETETVAKGIIKEILSQPGVTTVVSGGCHLGGIDIWAIEVGESLGLMSVIYLPEHRSWEFYKKRNINIAEASDEVHCIVVKELPRNYVGMRFKLCYHCGTSDHIKSGGCWTVKHAQKLGKQGFWHVI